MFGIWRKRKTRVIDHWYVHVYDYQTSTSEFYGAVERALEERQVPQMEISRILFYEGEFTTPKREYLRMRRERLVMDFCAAPFGTSWFFSCRFAEIRLTLRVWELLLLLLLCGLGWWTFSGVFGFFWGSVALGANVVAVALILNALAATGNDDFDSVLIKAPVVGALYELFLRRNHSYFREDTRIMYITLVDSILRSCVTEWLKNDGIENPAFVNNPHPMSPTGIFDRVIEAVGARIKQFLLWGIDAAERTGHRALDKLV